MGRVSGQIQALKSNRPIWETTLLFAGLVILETLLIFQALVSFSMGKRLCELMHIKQWLAHTKHFKNVNEYTFSMNI